jgi:hypothetical protein
MVGNGIKIDSVRVLMIYAGLGRDATKVIGNTVVDYNGGTIEWFTWTGSYGLELQLPVGGTLPTFLPIRVELEWL